MMIIDSHVHLTDPKLYDRLDEVINNAFEADVRKMIVSGVDYESSMLAIEIARKYDGVYATIGIHPSEVNKVDDNLKWIKENLSKPKVVGIGEIGLDYYWDKSFKDKQIDFFEKQLKIAEETGYPVVVHSRSAAEDTFSVLKNYNNKGVMHCYAYSVEMARKFIDLGYLLGIGGVVTFKNAKTIKKVVEEIELKHLITETDAPYLTPTPHRGKTNEPKYTKLVVEEIAKIKNIEVQIVKKQIYENARKIFKI